MWKNNSEVLVESLSDLVDELERVQVFGSLNLRRLFNKNRQVLGHKTSLDRLDDDIFKSVREFLQSCVAVELGSGQ